jgi:predicted nuclease with RNAse H fold
VKDTIVFGVDLTSNETRPTACLGLDSKLQPVYLGFLAKDSDIIAIINIFLPRVIAIDAPLSLPLKLCCPGESCGCQPSPAGENRQCDQELRQRGFPCYPTGKKSFIKNLICRGIELKNKLTCLGFQVIEVYPYASKVRLFGKTIPKKSTTQGISLLKERLGNLLPGLKPCVAMFDHNLCDASIAAYTAFLYRQNMVNVLGNKEEGSIFIPSSILNPSLAKRETTI